MYPPINDSDDLVGTLAVKRVMDFTFLNTISPEQERLAYSTIADYYDLKENRPRKLENKDYTQKITNQINQRVSDLIEEVPEDDRKDKDLWPSHIRQEVEAWGHVSNSVLNKCLPSNKQLSGKDTLDNLK